LLSGKYQIIMGFAVAVFSNMGGVTGEALFKDVDGGCRIIAKFTALPPGKHGFHIHKNGDLRGEGCAGACEHYNKGPATSHGGPPSTKGERHTGDLGNISGSPCKKYYFLKGVSADDLFGRTLIVHKDQDDLGKSTHEDSKTTGHSGKRIACAVIGRAKKCIMTRKRK
jgi:Cu-Zn family superoxide dismutase